MVNSLTPMPRKRRSFTCDASVPKVLKKKEEQRGKKYSEKEWKKAEKAEYKICEKETADYKKSYDNFGIFTVVATVLFILWNTTFANLIHNNNNERLNRIHQEYR